jgi:hypothetical protein
VPILVIGLDASDTKEIDIKSLESDLEVVKGSKNAYKDRHVKLVKRIINMTKKGNPCFLAK